MTPRALARIDDLTRRLAGALRSPRHACSLQGVGLGLAAAVLIDATLVRTILVPAAMRLMGDGNW
ncbi:MAG TPA: hypothetical protein VII47_06015 [Actinomycetota bacterium]